MDSKQNRLAEGRLGWAMVGVTHYDAIIWPCLFCILPLDLEMQKTPVFHSDKRLQKRRFFHQKFDRKFEKYVWDHPKMTPK